MTEQINKDSGAPQGARDLTWSYGTVLGAMGSRKTLVSIFPDAASPKLHSV
jgi:GH15 family glucan-1,4-alpha-glucosidase